MSVSQNGWTVISDRNSSYLHEWTIPASTGYFKLLFRHGSAGFLLAHFALWYAEKVEPVAGAGDDFGWAYREIFGSDEYSNHASGTAADLNASQHPRGTHTLSSTQLRKLTWRMKFYRGVLRHGAFYRSTVDEMHVEIDKDLPECESLARILMKVGRGKRIIAANPKQKAIILA